MAKHRIRNQLYLLVFVILLGAFAGAVVWVFLRAVALAAPLLWEKLPSRISFRWYPVILCAAGGLLTGLVHLKFGNYPESLDTVLAKVKRDKRYEYRNMAVLLIAAFLPLVFGASVGPEAGLTGVIVGLCYWVGDNIRFAKETRKNYTEVGIAVTLGVLFHVPLFGILEVEEDTSDRGSIVPSMRKTSKLLYYALATAAGFGIYTLLSDLFAPGLEGFPAFEQAEIHTQDYLAMILYLAAGFLMFLVFEFCEKLSKIISRMIPVVLRETLGGIVLGLTAVFLPMALFSGEEEMAHLMENFASYAPLFLILLSLAKLALTAWCISMGLRGGHFFPLIFACTSMGYGISLLLFQDAGPHAAFACAVITAAALGAQMKKPFAVVLLLLLCFPVRLILWLFVAAVIGKAAADVLGRRLSQARANAASRS